MNYIQLMHSSCWSENTRAIYDNQYTTESAAVMSDDMAELINDLYSFGESTSLANLPELATLRRWHPNILFHKLKTDVNSPYEIQVLEYDSRTRMDNYTDYTGLVIGEWEDALARDAIAYVYSYPLLNNKLPRFASVEKVIAGQSRSYFHLVWPLCEKGKVVQILVAATYNDFVVSPSIVNRGFKISPNKISGSFISSGRKEFTAVKAQFRSRMTINSKRKSVSMQISKIMANRIVNPLIN